MLRKNIFFWVQLLPKYKNYLIAAILVIPLLVWLFSLLLMHSSSNPTSEKGAVQPLPISGEDTISLAFVGDFMCHSTQFYQAKTDSGYDFRPSFSAIKPIIQSADLAFGNLETVTAGEEEKFTGYPQFNTPVGYVDAIADAGFDILTTANNHSLDRRYSGVEKTINELDKRALYHTGTYKTAEDRENILLVEKKGFKLAVLSYTYGTNGIPLPVGKEFCVNLIDSARIKYDVEKAKQNGAHLIIACMHWGNEYQRLPNDYQKNYAKYMSELGVNMIIGSHPHVLQPMDFIKQSTDSTFIVYSLGNFISGQRKAFTDYGSILNIQLIRQRATNKISFQEISYVPTYVSVSKGYRILPVKDAISAITTKQESNPAYSPSDLSRLLQIWPEVQKHMDHPGYGIYAAGEKK